METQAKHWLPLTEYALRSGMSISTLRRKIKANSIEFKMEDGRYLIRSDDLSTTGRGGFASSDDVIPPTLPVSRPTASPAAVEPATKISSSPSATASSPSTNNDEVAALREDFRRMQEDNLLRWKALEARVSGLARKLDFFAEQMAEAKMLVKIFEEKLDHRA